MAGALGFIPTIRKTGNEPFHAHGREIHGANILAFWQWANSDLLGNTERGRVAEYIVALDLGVTQKIKMGWSAYDLETRSGVKVEVKSSAYIQNWTQKGLSRIVFTIPKTLAWNPETNEFEKEARRQAEVYVFAVLAHRD